MADVMRWIRHDTQPVFPSPASATVIEIGDLCFLHPDDGAIKNAGAMMDQGSLALNQDAFQMYFLGVAEQRSKTGETAELRTATRGEFEYPCDSTTWLIGQMVGAQENSGGTALEDQKVIVVTDESKAIGVVAKNYASATTKVLIRIRSTIMKEALQAQVVGSSSGVV